MSSPLLPLSVVLIARHEAANLPRCLASVRGFAAEIIVGLDETSDDRAAVARSHGARVETLSGQEFRDTQNAVLALATQPWVLCLAADEEVSPELRQHLMAFFARADRDRFAGAQFPRLVWYINRWIRHGDGYSDYSPRLVRRGQARWGGDAFGHEKMICDGPVATLAGDLRHYSLPAPSSQVAKLNRFADQYLQQQQAKGGRFSLGAAVFRPPWQFFRGYILRRGFLDGYPGFYLAWANAFYVLVCQSRLYEEEHVRPAPTVQ